MAKSGSQIFGAKIQKVILVWKFKLLSTRFFNCCLNSLSIYETTKASFTTRSETVSVFDLCETIYLNLQHTQLLLCVPIKRATTHTKKAT